MPKNYYYLALYTFSPLKLYYAAAIVRFRFRTFISVNLQYRILSDLVITTSDLNLGNVLNNVFISALDLKLGKFRGNVLLYGGGISTLKSVEVTETGITFGAALTMNELEEKLKETAPHIQGINLIVLINIQGSNSVVSYSAFPSWRRLLKRRFCSTKTQMSLFKSIFRLRIAALSLENIGVPQEGFPLQKW